MMVQYRCLVRGESSVKVIVKENGRRVGVWYGSREVWERVIVKALGTVEVIELAPR